MLATSAWGQSNGGTPSLNSNVPVLASGQMPAAIPSASAELENVFQMNLSAGTHFDDNVLPGLTPRQWDSGYIFSPSFGFTETLPRVDWGVDYGPGIDISQNLNYRNQFTQKFDGHVTWLTSARGTLMAQQYYLVSTDPFAQLGQGNNLPGPGVSPNQSVYLPNIRRTQIVSNALYSYQIGEHTMFGLGGGFNQERFDNTPHSGPTTALIYSQVASGEAYISHQFNAKNQLGVQYGLQVLKFPRQNARTTTHSFEVFDQMNISPTSSFTLYGGPEYSQTANEIELSLGFIVITIPVSANQWSAAGGVIYNWIGNRVAVSVDYSRRVSDGGGLVGAVELNTGSAKLTTRLTSRWSFFTTVAGSSDQLLASSSSSQGSMLTYSGEVGLQQQIWRDVAMNWFYERLNETGGFAGFPVGNHDIAGASLTYTFTKPLGR
ncbi:MAG TPA: hypothetical protein VGR81_02500 [Candidatus Acidoferrales bacterium]|nr:hypothetical protein [Candidatus Acidoferrales bacterium]